MYLLQQLHQPKISEKFIGSLKPENEIEFLISSEKFFQNCLVLFEMLSEQIFLFCNFYI